MNRLQPRIPTASALGVCQFYLKAWLCGFPKAAVTVGGKNGRIAVFYADGNWYAREGYERFGELVSPYKDCEIEFARDEPAND